MDIVERLRSSKSGMEHVAADEITKLRAEVERLTTFETVLSQNGDITAQTIHKLRAELATAEAWRRENNDLIIELNVQLAEARAEIEVEEKRFNQLSDDYAEATKAMEFNFEQYQDVSRMLCWTQDKLAEAVKDAEQPKFALELPDGDKRVAKIWFVQKREDGKWHISITIDAAMRTTEESSVDGEEQP
jgi:ElaB/YqjD/DUF883 family membrane-anchored ribosome-binding protein